MGWLNLLVVAEDRCRAEHFPRLRRQLQEDHDHELDPRPWGKRVFRVAAHDKEYWDEHVRDPAIRHMPREKKGPPGGTGSGKDRAGHETEERTGRKKIKRKNLVTRLKNKLTKQGQGSLPSFPPPPDARAGGKGQGGKGLKKNQGRGGPPPGFTKPARNQLVREGARLTAGNRDQDQEDQGAGERRALRVGGPP